MRNKINFMTDMIKTKGVLFALKILYNSLEYLVKKNILGQEKIIRKINNIYSMELSLKVKAVDRILYLFGYREELETEIVKKNVKKGMRVLDLGANIGYYTLLMAKLVGEKGKVYSVEPYQPNFKRLKRNILINQLSRRVVLDNIAISDKTRFVDFFVGSSHNLGSLFNNENDQVQKKIKVKALSLTDYLKNKLPIDFIRMDIERGELKVFKDLMENWPYSYPPKILFEVHPLGFKDPDPEFTPYLNWLAERYFPKYVVSSLNPHAIYKFKFLGYSPQRITFRGQALFENIKSQHLIEIAARRPKVTRAILLIRR